MDIPGRDTDVNLNVEGEESGLGRVAKQLNAITQTILGVAGASESADDEVDDLEEELREAGQAGVEGAGGLASFIAATEGAEAAVDDLDDEIDDFDVGGFLDFLDPDDIDERRSSLADLVDELTEAGDEISDFERDFASDSGKTYWSGDGGLFTTKQVLRDLADVESKAESISEIFEDSGDGDGLAGAVPGSDGSDDDIANLDPLFFQEGSVSELADASISDFTVNEDIDRLKRRYAELASDLAEAAKVPELVDLDAVSDKRIRTFVTEATRDNPLNTEFFSGRNGRAVPQDQLQTIFEEILREEGRVTPEAFSGAIEERYDEALDTAEERRRRIDKIGDRLNEASKSVAEAFTGLEEIDEFETTHALTNLRSAVEDSDEYDTDEPGLIGQILEQEPGDSDLRRRAERFQQTRLDAFDNIFSQLEGDLYDDRSELERVFRELTETPLEDLDTEKTRRKFSKTNTLDGYSELLDQIIAFDENVVSPLKESDEFDDDNFDAISDILVGMSGTSDRFEEFNSRLVNRRISDLRQREPANATKSFGFDRSDFNRVQSLFSNFANAVDEPEELMGAFEQIDEFDGDMQQVFDILNARYTEDVEGEQALRDKKTVADVVDRITRDPDLLKLATQAIDDDGRLDRTTLNRALDRSAFDSEQAQTMRAFADVFGEDILGQYTASRMSRDRIDDTFPDEDIVDIDTLITDMFDTNAPAEREPLNRAIRDLQRRDVPLAQETIRANLFQQAADTDSEEFKRLINDVNRMIAEGEIDVASLMDFDEIEPEFKREISRQLQDTDVAQGAVDDLTDRIFEDIEKAVRESDDLDSLDDLFHDADARNLRDILSIERENIEEYNTEWEEIIDNTEEATKNIRRFYEFLAGEDTDVLEDDESLVQGFDRFIKRAEEHRVQSLIGDEDLTRVDVQMGRAFRRAVAGEIPDDAGPISGRVLRGTRRVSEWLPDFLVDTERQAKEAGTGIQRFQNALRKLSPELGITSANLGPLNVSLRNFGSVIVGLVTVLGPLVTLLGGLITGFATLAGAVGSVTAVGALGFFEQIESQFAGIDDRMEAMEATFNAVRTMGRRALEPLEDVEIAGLTGVQLFQRSIQRSIQLLGHFADIFAEIAEMEEITRAVNRISGALFSGDGGPTMMEAMAVATERLVPIITDLIVYVINNFPEFIIFVSRISDMIDGPLAFALTEWIDLFSSLITIGAGFVWAYANVAGVIAWVVNELEDLAGMLDILPDGLFGGGGGGPGGLFRLGQVIGGILALGAGITVFKKLASAITVTANALGKLLKIAGRGGRFSRITRLGQMLSNVGRSGGRMIGGRQTTLSQYTKSGGFLSRFARGAYGRTLGPIVDAVKRMRGRKTGLFPRLLGGAGNKNLSDMIRRLFGGGRGRGQMTLIDIFKKGSGFVKRLGSALKISKLAKLTKIISPIVKLGKLGARFIPVLGWLAWLPDIYRVLNRLYEDYKAATGQGPEWKSYKNQHPWLTKQESKRVAQLYNQGKDRRAEQLVMEEQAEKFENQNERIDNTVPFIEILVEGEVDPERTAELVGRKVKQAERLSDRHYGPTGGYRGT